MAIVDPLFRTCSRCQFVHCVETCPRCGPIDDGGPAFPASHPDEDGWTAPGMTLRDYFAAKALQGALAYPRASLSSSRSAEYAKYAYELADAMIKARDA